MFTTRLCFVFSIFYVYVCYLGSFFFVEHLLSLVILRNFVGDVGEVEEVENQFHKMIDIFTDLVDKECCGSIIASSSTIN
jgi:hypothetical protein